MVNVVLMGHSCSGKTSLAMELERQGLRRIVTYTTRPPRPDERRWLDYNFVTESTFEHLAREGFFAEVTEYEAKFGHCFYGSAKHDYAGDGDTVVVLNPVGAASLDVPNTFVVYLDLPYKTLVQRAFRRGDRADEFQRRYAADTELLEQYVGDFSWFLRITHVISTEIMAYQILSRIRYQGEDPFENVFQPVLF